MNREQLQKVRDALSEGCGWSDQVLADYDEKYARHPATEATREFITDSQNKIIEAIAILGRALAAPEQEPVAWATFDGEGSYDLRLYEDNENYLDEYRKMNGDKYAGWVIPLYAAPIPAPQRETDVVEALRRCLDELKDHNDSPYCDFHDSFNDIMEQAESALGAKNVDRAPHARDAVAWMPDTGYVFAPDKNTSNAPAPQQREWQDLSPLEMRDTLRNCAASTFDKLAPNWYEVRQFARAIEAALRTKNTGER